MNGSVEDLNQTQYEALQEFRRNVSDVLTSHNTDTWLLKWLRAHNFNLRKTERIFRGIQHCRTVYEIDSLLENYVKPEVACKYEYTCSLGIARNGSPIRYNRIGSGDHAGLLMSMSIYEVVLYCTYMIEMDLAMLRKENEKTGRDVSEITYILDFDCFSLSQVMHKSVIETALDLVQLIQDHYPEIWGNILIVNAPSYFDKIFNLFKPIIRLNMLKKISLVSRDSSPQLLLKYIDEDVLPVFLGGKRVDSSGNPKCSEFVKFGSKIPEDYYLRNRTPLLPTDPGVTSLWVPARSVFNHSVVIRNASSRMRVEIRTENGSIGLKMMFREFGEDPDKLDLPTTHEYLDDDDPRCNVRFISPPQRMQSHTSPIDVFVNTPWKGIYIFRFDNTYSWFTSRKIIFRIQETGGRPTKGIVGDHATI